MLLCRFSQSSNKLNLHVPQSKPSKGSIHMARAIDQIPQHIPSVGPLPQRLRLLEPKVDMHVSSCNRSRCSKSAGHSAVVAARSESGPSILHPRGGAATSLRGDEERCSTDLSRLRRGTMQRTFFSLSLDSLGRSNFCGARLYTRCRKTVLWTQQNLQLNFTRTRVLCLPILCSACADQRSSGFPP